MLTALRQDVAALRERMQAPLVMRYERAAQMLDVSVSKLRGLIRSGEIVPVKLGGRKMVPLSELERVSRPKLPKKLAARAPKASVLVDAKAYRESLKKRR